MRLTVQYVLRVLRKVTLVNILRLPFAQREEKKNSINLKRKTIVINVDRLMMWKKAR